MKKVILAIENKKIRKKFKEINNQKIEVKEIHYREGILETLKKEKKIDLIFLNEKLPGEISIIDLIKKIKAIDKNINIIFIFNKKNEEKEKILIKLGIKNIYNINKIKQANIINKLIKNNNEKHEKRILKIIKNMFKISKNKKRNKVKINNKNKIIIFFGKNESEKIKIIYFIIFYFKKIKKKILLISFINKEKIINKKENKINNFEKIILNINKNNIENKFKNFIKEKKNKYDYILIDLGCIENRNTIKKLLNNDIKTIYIVDNDLLGIKEIINYNKKSKSKNDAKENSLHIVCKKDNFSAISNLIIKRLIKNFYNFPSVFFKKEYINLEEKIKKGQKIKINFKTKKLLEKILQ